jgi:hypothetical protein
MKDLKEYIYEGLLRGQKSTLDAGETDLKDAYNLPTYKDVRKSVFNPNIAIIDWVCPDLFNKYAGKTATTRDMAGLQFRLYKGPAAKSDIPYSLDISCINKRHSNSWGIPGWKAYIYENEKFAIKQVLQLIEKLAFEPGKLDEFFEQADKSYKAVRQSEKIKNPLTDL